MYLGPRFKDSNKKLVYEYICRTLLVIFTGKDLLIITKEMSNYNSILLVGLAVAIPKLELFISLFGALCLATLGIAFPAIIDMSTNWHNLSGMRFKLNLVKNTALIIFGLIGLVVGTYTAIHEIVDSFNKEAKK